MRLAERDAPKEQNRRTGVELGTLMLRLDQPEELAER